MPKPVDPSSYTKAHRFFRDLRVQLLHESPHILNVLTDEGITGREIIAALERQAIACDQGLDPEEVLSVEDWAALESMGKHAGLYQEKPPPKKAAHLTALRQAYNAVQQMCYKTYAVGGGALDDEYGILGSDRVFQQAGLVAESIAWGDEEPKFFWQSSSAPMTPAQRKKDMLRIELKKMLTERVASLIDEFRRDWIFKG